MLGGFGQAMILVCSIAAGALILPFFFLHGSHIYLTTLTMSSGGEDRFRWPRESYTEWFGQGAVVFGVLFVWSILALIPVGLVLIVLPAEYGIGVWALIVYLMAPISLCSVLTAPSKLLFLYPPLIGRLLRHAKGLAFVYFITMQLPLVVVFGLWLLVVRRNPLGIFVVGVALPPALLLHARAWARLVWLALNYDRKPRKKKKRKRKPERVEEAQDVALDRVEEDDADYAVKPTIGPTGERLVTMTEYYDQQHEYERKIRVRVGDPIPDPFEGPSIPTYQAALGDKIFSFVVDRESIGVCGTYGLVCLIAMTLLFIFVTMMS